MDAVYVGWLSILPPMIAIILALITKEVLFSLIAGVLSGTIIYSIASGMNPIVGPVSTVFDVMIQKADMNIIIFCFLLGGLVYLINASGGAQVSTPSSSKVTTSSFLDWSLSLSSFCLTDFFVRSNCLTEKLSPRFLFKSAMPLVTSSSCCSRIALCRSMLIGIFSN